MRWQLAVLAERCVYLMDDLDDGGFKQCENIGPWQRPGADDDYIHVCRMHKESIDREEAFIVIAESGEAT